MDDNHRLGGYPAYEEKELMRIHSKPERGKGVAVIGISRHRLGTDGRGMTTLVALHGCELRCRYCVNKECWEPEEKFRHYTPQALYDEVKVDDLYFRATGGGVTFGGGEPCLQADFIVEFRKICEPAWKIRVETSLNVNRLLIDKLAPVVDEWIIDIKAEHSIPYKKYTGGFWPFTMDNLNHITSNDRLGVPKDRIHIRVPVIPGYVDDTQAEKTGKMFRDSWKFRNVEVFRYVTDEKDLAVPVKGSGKSLCRLLRGIRREVAANNGLHMTEHHCTHRGECSGTCPACEMEAEELARKLRGKQISLSDSTLERMEAFDRMEDKRSGKKTNLLKILAARLFHSGTDDSSKEDYYS